MSKLKDYNIPGWPEKKEISCRCLHNTTCGCNEERYSKMLDIIENLEFNPAELVELDAERIIEIFIEYVYVLKLGLREDTRKRIVKALVNSKKDILK